MPIKQSKADFMKKLSETKNGYQFEIIGEYNGSKNKVKVRHTLCNHEWDVIPQNLLRYLSEGKYGCPNCAEKNRTTRKRKSQEQFEKEIFEKWGNEYVITSKYEGLSEDIKVKHTKCNYEWTTKASSIWSKYGCPNCAGNVKNTHEDFISLIKAIWGDEISIISKYENSDEKVLARHNKCGHEWNVRAITLSKRKASCPKCSGNNKKTQKEFEEAVYKAVGKEYTVLGEYTGKNNKVLMKHNLCGNEWLVVPDNFLNGGTRCPKERRSKGEVKISEFLIKNNIEHEEQYSFGDLKDKYALRFDFAIFKSGILYCLIEFDGLQHNKIIEYFGGIEGFEERVKKDTMKIEYCNQKGIKLFRINYTQLKSIEVILTDVLSEIL